MSKLKDTKDLYEEVDILMYQASGILSALSSNDNFTTLPAAEEAAALGAAERLLRQAQVIHQQLFDALWKQGEKAA